MLSSQPIYTRVIIGEETRSPINYTSRNEEIRLDENTPCLEVHIIPFPEQIRRAFINKQRIAESLGQIAHYVDLRGQFYKPDYVIGLTHLKVGELAVKTFHFDLITDLPEASYPDRVLDALKEEYRGDPCVVVMPTDRLRQVYLTGEALDSTQKAAHRANLIDSLEINTKIALSKYETPILDD